MICEAVPSIPPGFSHVFYIFFFPFDYLKHTHAHAHRPMFVLSEGAYLSSVFVAQVLLAMHANVEDRGIKGDITPLMAAASGGYVDIVKLLLVHGADVNAQSSTGERLTCSIHKHALSYT